MWQPDKALGRRYPTLSLTEERRLIAQAQHGSPESAQELVLRHVGFVIFRPRKRVFPDLLPRFGDDLLSSAIPVLYQKIATYDLDYRDKQGYPKPVKFVSYIWKPQRTPAPFQLPPNENSPGNLSSCGTMRKSSPRVVMLHV